MSTLTLPRPIVEDYRKFYDLIERNPIYIPISEAAAFLHIDPEGLRCAIDQGRCPFAFSWKKNNRGNKAFKIPTIAFYNWVMQGHGAQFVEEYIQSDMEAVTR